MKLTIEIWFIPFLLLLLLFNVGRGESVEKYANCDKSGIPLVRSIEGIRAGSYGRPGFAHQTIAGVVHHGMREVEVWLQTFGPGGGTPIHRHDCEEVFLVLYGTGSAFFSTVALPGDGANGRPGLPAEHGIFANSTFIVPPNLVHQIKNTKVDADLQLLVVISQPPIQVYTYPSWNHPHSGASLKAPYPWDAVCP